MSDKSRQPTYDDLSDDMKERVEKRICDCGMETDRSEGISCDACTGEVRHRCPGCGRTDLRSREDGPDPCTPRSYPHLTPEGVRCSSSGWEIEVLN